MIKFTEVKKSSEDDINFLYYLLNKRLHLISHDSNTKFEEHKNFVKNNPYRHWFIISDKETKIGSAYICNDNVVGINLIEDQQEIYKIIIDFILDNYEPLPEIKSVRNKNFLVNTNPKNEELKSALFNLKMPLIQYSFVIKK
tara:strand:+ start:1049 stop:1474 length:426 start_codon:yes stop_codon:yes gene_type:complete